MAEAMQRNDDEKVWYQAYLDTAFVDEVRMKNATHPDQLLDMPGVALKSTSRHMAAPMSGFPEHFGKLVSYDEAGDQVVVRSHGAPGDPRCVWTGTVRQYIDMWIVD